ncbi:MAG: ribosome-binding factor A [Candidatus Pacebacteria bacterium]|nr:ribosome-binding factor A [Candidatus Paceibacterota bacterium]
MSNHRVQIAQLLGAAAATFVNTWSNRQSLITITRTELSDSLDHVEFFVSIFPEEAEGPALGFLMRKRTECREYLKTHVPLGKIPHVEFSIDEGEKKRRQVDALLKS